VIKQIQLFALTVWVSILPGVVLASGSDTMPDDQAIKASQLKQEEMRLPGTKEMGAAADKAATTLSAPELTDGKLEGAMRVIKGIPIAPPNPSALDELFKQVEKPLFPLESPQENLMVMVSFSMPEETLRNLARQADKAGAVLVIRGMVDDSLQATTKAVQKVLGEEGGDSTFQINPNVFRAYKVEDVPAFVLARKPIGDGDSCTHGDDYVSVRGDVTLEYAIRKLGDNKGWEDTAGKYLNALRGEK
jgi:conjugal transfer pilus assembly protein TrbC